MNDPHYPKLITARQMSFSYEQSNILENIDFSLQKGDYITILGLNGSGKSTLLKLLLGLLKPTQGNIEHSKELRIGYVPQRWHPDPSLPIHCYTLLDLSFEIQKDITSKERTDIIYQSLHDWGLSQQAHQAIHSLSGGQWQRLLMARALIRRPNLLALDEPNQGVDLKGQHQFYQRLESLHQQGMTILMISHDIAHALSYSHHIMALSENKICCQGSANDIMQNPEYHQRFVCAHQHLHCDHKGHPNA